jgi:hypothetical protein
VTRQPAPDPTPDEQAVIDRFGIWAHEERLTRLADDLNREIGRIQARAAGGERTDVPPSERLCAGGVERRYCCGLPGACGDC